VTDKTANFLIFIRTFLMSAFLIFGVKTFAGNFLKKNKPDVEISCLEAPVDSTHLKIKPGKIWLDTDGDVINAHGGGILFHQGVYYWYGEKRGKRESLGINVYSSEDLINWKFENLALSHSSESGNPIEKGAIMERPKVIYNENTKQYVMYFHLELKGQGYGAAHRGVAVSDSPTGEFKLIKSGRVNAGEWPENMSEIERNATDKPEDYEWWTAPWRKAIEKGLFLRRDFENGQMSRDMTLYVDDDKIAYLIYSSEDNLTLHIAELTDDYLGYTGKYIRVIPGGHFEAPAVFKKGNRYFMVVSKATGWEPNAAVLLSSDSIMGEWRMVGDFAFGPDAETTFKSQSTFVLPVQGKQDSFIYMGDRWNPDNLKDSRYIWLPIQFTGETPFIVNYSEWDFDAFQD